MGPVFYEGHVVCRGCGCHSDFSFCPVLHMLLKTLKSVTYE